MTQDIFLVAPPDGEAAQLARDLEVILAGSAVAALLVPAGGRDDAAYGLLVAALREVAQDRQCAVLLDNRPDLVKALEADGVHMDADLPGLRKAIAALKPDHIVGVGAIGSRHDAMEAGELDVDYLLFGDIGDDPASAAGMAEWWAETFEVPCVYLAADLDDPALDHVSSEFIGFGPSAWSDRNRLAARLAAEGEI